MSTIRKPPLADKSVQRRLYLEKRRSLLSSGKKIDADREIQSRLILTAAYREADTLLVYAAREHEIDTAMVICAALANHKIVALPRCEEDGVMRFYRIRSMSDLIPGRFGIREPDPACELFEPGARTLCVCPCLCCDMQGYRLGFGGGYYDRFLSDYPGTSAVLCYADALLPELRHEPHDIPVNIIVTEQFVRIIQPSQKEDRDD